MATRKITKKGVDPTPAVTQKNAPAKKASPKVKSRRRLDIEKLRALMKTHKPPQSWYDEDYEGLY
jgi:hypothetical protein